MSEKSKQKPKPNKDPSLKYSENTGTGFKSHQALCNFTEKTLAKLFAKDELLSDIPGDISHEEVLDQIALVKGLSITVYIERQFFPKLKIVVPHSKCSVLDLRKAIRRAVDLGRKRAKNSERFSDYERTRKLSWKYIWRTFCLTLKGKPLKDHELLSDYGIINKTNLKFMKRSKLERQGKQKSFKSKELPQVHKMI